MCLFTGMMNWTSQVEEAPSRPSIRNQCWRGFYLVISSVCRHCNPGACLDSLGSGWSYYSCHYIIARWQTCQLVLFAPLSPIVVRQINCCKLLHLWCQHYCCNSSVFISEVKEPHLPSLPSPASPCFICFQQILLYASRSTYVYFNLCVLVTLYTNTYSVQSYFLLGTVKRCPCHVLL